MFSRTEIGVNSKYGFKKLYIHALNDCPPDCLRCTTSNEQMICLECLPTNPSCNHLVPLIIDATDSTSYNGFKNSDND